FSPRRGTPAADLPETVPPGVVAERRQRLRELDGELSEAYYRSLIGRRLEVLVEGAYPNRGGYVMGTSCRYAPVVLEGHLPALIARRVPVQAVAVAGGVVFAHPESESGLVSRPPRAFDGEAPFHRRLSLPQVPPAVQGAGAAGGSVSDVNLIAAAVC